ncbi:MAG: S1 RNA-binding domain-containing protein [Clostridia bacterium]|nr:S1 RNA-binding domain-containing protein [Clostridia bacterium]NCC69495.1 S1 RNA-binding domain-containing protein [Clostridia bacterium]
MQLEVGSVVEGRVTGITKFGAFVTLEDGKSGLVHISEVANTFVNDVNDFVKEGQTVKVRIIGIGESGKINLSIKKAEEQPAEYRQSRPAPQPRHFVQHQSAQRENEASADVSFEDKLKHFMQDADSRIAENKRYSDRRSGNRKRK